ncbi:MAG: hypothetical protein M1818_007783 [Claussenomyces sp. TS43310]|nr:MAG: hypothetical protein M1818_007783 [Claussenomyces sp. TS43310]
MGRIMQALPSFLTPPRSSKHQDFADVSDESDDEPSMPHMTSRERRRAPEEYHNNGGNAVKQSLGKTGRSQPPNSFKMPYERARPSSSSIQLDRPRSPPPGYNGANDTADRRQTWGAPGTTGGEDTRAREGGVSDGVPAEAQAVQRSLDDYKTALKGWKQHHNVFMSGFQEVYLPGLEQCYMRISPQFEAALQPLCGPQELNMCMRHWEQETKRFSDAALTCANTMTGLGRNAWNEVVLLNEPAANGLALMNKLRTDMDSAYDIYVEALEASKENLWYTLDFNIAGHQDLKNNVRESFFGLFNKLQIFKVEHTGGLFTLTKPDLGSTGSRRVETTQGRHR